MATQLRIVVGITGGIAAYKALSVIRAFVQDGHHVTVVATESAFEFVGRASLEALSRNPVAVGLYDDVAGVAHVRLGQEADLVVIAPATAHTIATIAQGLAPNLLSNIVLATRGRVLVAPAMHTEMWLNEATATNVETLRSRGIAVVGPAIGPLTGTDSGPGRMAEPEDIVAASYSLAHSRPEKDLAGRRILISGGGTREPLDPVRYLGNRSSGRQSIALVRAAVTRGADVIFVHGFMDEKPPVGVDAIFAPTAAEMHDHVIREAKDADVAILAAAVADFTPQYVANEKLKKTGADETLTLELVTTPDILRHVCTMPSRPRIVVGFAAETATGDQLLALARDKLVRKGCDVIVANTVSWNVGFESESNEVAILGTELPSIVHAAGEKLTVAHRILDVLV